VKGCQRPEKLEQPNRFGTCFKNLLTLSGHSARLPLTLLTAILLPTATDPKRELSVPCANALLGSSSEPFCTPPPGAASPNLPGTGQDSLVAVTQVVKEFWDAVRNGQDSFALLTPAAQKCIVDNGFKFSPPASEGARYQIGDAELIEADKAIVESIWTDIDADGQPHDNNITVALKRVDGKWRVSGMAADLGPDEPPFVMNLEDPAEFYGPPSPGTASTIRQASDPFQQPLQR